MGAGAGGGAQGVSLASCVALSGGGAPGGGCQPVRQRSCPPARRWPLSQAPGVPKTGRGVYVHCAGGIGRTGTVVGCYLVRHGMQGEAALEEIMRLRHAMPNGGDLSPRREPQRQMVRTWPIGR